MPRPQSYTDVDYQHKGHIMDRFIYKRIPLASAQEFKATGFLSYPADSRISATRIKEALSSEFGSCTLQIEIAKLPPSAKLVDIQYDFAWFTANSEQRILLMKVTGRDEADWLSWAEALGAETATQKLDLIDDELTELYAKETEVVILGIKRLYANFVTVATGL